MASRSLRTGAGNSRRQSRRAKGYRVGGCRFSRTPGRSPIRRSCRRPRTPRSRNRGNHTSGGHSRRRPGSTIQGPAHQAAQPAGLHVRAAFRSRDNESGAYPSRSNRAWQTHLAGHWLKHCGATAVCRARGLATLGFNPGQDQKVSEGALTAYTGNIQSRIWRPVAVFGTADTWPGLRSR